MPYISAARRERANWQRLPEVVELIVKVDGCQPEEAQRQISEALADGDLWPLRWEHERPLPRGSTGGLTMPLDHPPRRWSKAQLGNIDWAAGTALDQSEYTPRKGRRRCLLIHRSAIAQHRREPADRERPLARPEPSDAPPPSPAIYRTGLPGKPTSWHLIEPECRRCWEAGERHPNDRTGRESPSEWARVLIAWLRSKHPTAPIPTPKTAGNKLSELLRELAATARPKS
jgi:hypothetical protein